MKNIARFLLGGATGANLLLFIITMTVQDYGLEFPLTYFTRMTFAFTLIVLMEKK